MKLRFFSKANFWQQINQSIFRVSLITFLILFLVEYLEPGFVTNWFNPVWLLIITIVSGILVITKD